MSEVGMETVVSMALTALLPWDWPNGTATSARIAPAATNHRAFMIDLLGK
jgi:hypothetical protein